MADGDRDWRAEGEACVDLLAELIRIPSVNHGTRAEGDGNERPCAELLADRFRAAGLEPKIFEKERGRASVVTRLRGTGEKPPILLNAHLDVVPADASKWRRAPFSGDIHDGFVWGRGAIDMKHMAALSATVLMRLAREKRKLTRDVIFAGVADEEAGCELGARFLVDDHADEVRAEYVLGEIGAFNVDVLGRRFYPIQVAEKGVCWVKATFEGKPGHGSMPDPDSAVVKLARALQRLSSRRMPVHPTETARQFIEGMARELPRAQSKVLRRLTTPQVSGLILDFLIRDKGQRRSFGAMLSNTATPTVVRAGAKVNVIPGEATVELDGRTLPGQSESQFLAELRDALGERARLEVTRSMPAVEASPDSPLFRHLGRTIEKHDALGTPLPYLIPGFTDAKAYSRLGAQCYGFSPIQFDPTKNVDFASMYHGHDERAPVAGLHWGVRVLYDALVDFTA